MNGHFLPSLRASPFNPEPHPPPQGYQPQCKAIQRYSRQPSAHSIAKVSLGWFQPQVLLLHSEARGLRSSCNYVTVDTFLT